MPNDTHRLRHLGTSPILEANPRRLFDRGVFVPPIVSPAVPPNTSRLRVTVTAAHSDADVGEIAEAVAATWHEVIPTPAHVQQS